MVNDMKVKKYLQVVSLAILVAILFTVAVNAWLAYTLTKEIGIIASTRESYFERGDGSSENPFIIARPIQMYYFAWLQDLGFFNKDDNGEISQVYFKIDYKNDETVFDTIEIDMDGYSIPPIGTPQYPFIGNFDGNNSVISNAIIDNSLSEFTNVPEMDSTNDVTEGAQIVGFFGVIGSVSSHTETSVNIGGNTYTYSSQINEVKNFILSNISVKSTDPKDSKTLIGIVAGYVNGGLNGVGVYNCSIEVEDGIQSIDSQDSLSQYSLVGYSQVAVDIYQSQSGPSGTDWGGSIDLQTLNSRLHNAYGTSTSTSAYYNYNRNNMSLVMTRSANANPNSRSVIYRYRSGTVIPINMDDTFMTLPTNTGYFVGSNIQNAANGSPKSSSYYIDYICNSLSSASVDYTKVYNGNQAKYNPNTLEVLTFYNNQWYRITDSYNTNHSQVNSTISSYQAKTVDELGFEKYNKARDDLDAIFKKDNNSSETLIHGIHFDTNVPSYSSVTNANVSILGRNYSNYPLVNSSADFHVKDPGKITFFAGTYYSMSSTSYSNAFNQNKSYGGYTRDTYFNDSFFSLSVVISRDPNNHSISANNFKTISKIYRDADGTSDCPYIYLYTDGSYSKTKTADDVEVFDMSVMNSKAPVNLALYYFEIPVNPGEYVMGAVSSSQTRGAYMIYLDISANSGGSGATVADYVTGVDFVSSIDTSVISEISNNIPSATFSIDEGFSGNVRRITFSREDSVDGTTITISIFGDVIASGYVGKNNVISQDKTIIVNYFIE